MCAYETWTFHFMSSGSFDPLPGELLAWVSLLHPRSFFVGTEVFSFCSLLLCLALFPLPRQMHYGVNAVGRTLMPYQAALPLVPCTSLLLSTCFAVDGSVADPRSKLHPSRFLWLIAACAGEEPRGIGSSSIISILLFFKMFLLLAFLFSSSFPTDRGSVTYLCIPHKDLEVLCRVAFSLILLALLLLPLSLTFPCLQVIV